MQNNHTTTILDDYLDQHRYYWQLLLNATEHHERTNLARVIHNLDANIRHLQLFTCHESI